MNQVRKIQTDKKGRKMERKGMKKVNIRRKKEGRKKEKGTEGKKGQQEYLGEQRTNNGFEILKA